MSEEIKVGAALVEIKAGIDELKNGLNKAKSVAQKGASEIQQKMSNIKIQMDDRLLKLKISDVQKLNDKLKARLEEKKKLNFDLRSIEVTRKQIESTTNALRGLNKEAEKSPKVNGSNIFGSVAGIAGGLGIAVGAAEMARATVEAIKLAGEVEGVETAFNSLNQQNLLSDLRKATRETISDFELMKLTMRASNFKIPLSEMATYMEFAQKRATQTGEAVDYLANSIVDGIGRKSTLVLDNLGISATELQNEVRKVGDFGQATGNIVRRELDKMGEVALTTKDELAQITAEFDNIRVEVGKAAIQSTNWIVSLTKSKDKIQTIVNLLNDAEGKEQRKTDAQRAYNKELTDTINLTRERVQEENKSSTVDGISKRIDAVRKRIAEFSKLPANSSLEDLGKYFDALKGEGKLRFAPLITELKTFIQLHSELKTVFDPYSNTIGAIEQRIATLKEKLSGFKPGDIGLAQTKAEIEKLENILNPKIKDKATVKINFEIDENELEKEFENIGVAERVREFLKFDLSAGVDDVKTLKEMLSGLELGTVDSDQLETVLDNIIEKLHLLNQGGGEGSKNSFDDFIKYQTEGMNALSEGYSILENGITNVFHLLRIRASEDASEMERVFIDMGNSVIRMIQQIIVRWALLNTLSFAFGGGGVNILTAAGLAKGGSITNSGGNISYAPYKKFATGVSNFIVPPGFNRDNYIVGVQSGERLDVTPANQVGKSSGNVDNATLRTIAGRVGATNAILSDRLDGLISATVNRTLETALKGNDIVVSYDQSKQNKRMYMGQS